jgi:hypothetical protein
MMEIQFDVAEMTHLTIENLFSMIFLAKPELLVAANTLNKLGRNGNKSLRDIS